MLSTSIKRKIADSLPKSLLEMLISLRYAGQRLPSYRVYESYVEGKKGIEIGGPSVLFKTVLPLYKKLGDLDGVNFANNTVWEGRIAPGKNFNYIGDRKGIQFISDGTDLAAIGADSYDFLLSSNCLEHIANPLKALLEWKRVVRAGGALILVVPNKSSNFDHKRPVTKLQHLLDDLNSDISEYDLTHLDEILTLHDLALDPPAGDLESFRRRSLDNFNNRTLHHHVFDEALIRAMFEHIGLDVIETSETRKDFFALAIKPLG